MATRHIHAHAHSHTDAHMHMHLTEHAMIQDFVYYVYFFVRNVSVLELGLVMSSTNRIIWQVVPGPDS